MPFDTPFGIGEIPALCVLGPVCKKLLEMMGQDYAFCWEKEWQFDGLCNNHLMMCMGGKFHRLSSRLLICGIGPVVVVQKS